MPLKVKIDGDSKDLQRSVNQAKGKLDDMGTSGANAGKKASKGIDSAVKSLTKFATGFFAVSKVVGFFNGYIRNYGDQLGKLQSVTGIGADTLDKLRLNAELAGLAFADITNGLKFLAKGMGEAIQGNKTYEDSFKRLGLSVNDLTKIDPTEQFLTVAEALNRIEDSNERVSIGTELLGRNFFKMQNLLPNLRKNLEETSTAWTPESAKSIEKFNDNLTILKNNIQGTLLPVTLELVEAMNNLFPKKDTVISVAREHIRRYSDQLNELKYKLKTLNDYKKQGFGVDEEAIAKLERRVKLTKKNLEQSRESLKLANKQEKAAKESKAKTGGTGDTAVKNQYDTIAELERERLKLLGKNKEYEIAQLEQKYLELGQTHKDHYDVLNSLSENAAIERAAINKKYYDAELAAVAKANDAKNKKEQEFMSEHNATLKAAADYDAQVIQENSIRAAEEFENTWGQSADSMRQSFASGMTDGLFEFIDGTKSAEQAFSQFAASFLKNIAQMIIQQQILNVVKRVSGGWGGAAGAVTASANGNIIANGEVQAFANGGVVDSPTLFPMKSGVGLMGEAGPEAIVPLPDGRRIPVDMKGGGGKSIAQNNSISITVQSSGTSEEDARRTAEIMRAEIKRTLMNERRVGGSLR
jgi:lambda family phage tail tape measure protein